MMPTMICSRWPVSISRCWRHGEREETYDGLDSGVGSKLRLPQSRLRRLSWFGHDSSLAEVILGPQHVSVAAAGEMQRWDSCRGLEREMLRM